ncbi:MAG: pyruvate, phosphate dikinase [Christensenellales bacterium]|jgi:pyruvate,orthophosphate dikinase
MKYVYLFSEGNASMRNLLGGKGANLAEMTSLNLPVPQGFTITTQACNQYYADGKVISQQIVDEIYENMSKLEEICGKKFGDLENPFLVSVRSGARASMPGMMDTILNLGLNDVAVEGLANLTGNPRFAYDSYRRFIQMFSDVVMEIEKSNFEAILDEIKEKKGVIEDTELDIEDLKTVVLRYKEFYKKEKGTEFPQDAKEQLLEAVKAVFRSWDNDRATVYRRMNDIPWEWGTAVNVQAMVFGNMGEDSGTGVAFTRDPATGEKTLYGDYLMNAQGEDVVAGIRTPEPISRLKEQMPHIYEQFAQFAQKLENHYRDMQDMEFTIERGTLYMLQTRNGKRSAASAIKVAADLVAEGMITKEEALMKIDPKQLDSLLHPTFDPEVLKTAEVAARGIDASPGQVSGRIYFTAADAKAAADRGEDVILVRKETSPEDIEGMYAALGILTSVGGKTSHAAVVARGIGTCCVAGCSEAIISETDKTLTLRETVLKEGEYISLNGSTGDVYAQLIPSQEAVLSEDYYSIMSWADDVRKLKVRTNADTPKDAQRAVEFGAEGVGLCRTEHMFFDENRISAMREMILAKDVDSRKRALAKLLPMQKADFKGIYLAMGERPITIRFLDPPLHEFLPHDDADIEALAKEMGVSFNELKQNVAQLQELNPMLGHRGCRLAVTYPEIAEMQTRAVIEAAVEVCQEQGISILPEIMIPLVCEAKEFEYVKEIVVRTATAVMEEKGAKIDYLVGTMIEVPRATLTADKIAKEAEFFSFGTNDLSQMTFAFSRDDAGKFLDDYYDKKIFDFDPFARVDQEGVGRLMEIAVELGQSVRKDIKLGICGEHGGDPSTIEFCHRIGLDYVSCSPFRVPIARLAAAQAQIKNRS